MNWLLLLAGILIVLITLVDVVWTAMWVGGGAGPVTRAVANATWQGLGVVGHQRHRLMVISGPLILTLTVLAWVFLLWSGWLLTFTSQATAVLTTSTDVPADLSDRIYFVGYTIFTLGNGDFSHNGAGWQAATALASGSGLFMITLAITYLLSVISAAVSARAFAVEVDGLGQTAGDVVSAGWDGESYAGLSLSLQSLSSQLSKLSQQYLAYPVLQYFHAEGPGKSPIIAIVRLDQILQVSANGVPSQCGAPTVLHNSLRSAIESALDSLPRKFVEPVEEGLPEPDLEPLRASRRPVLEGPDFSLKLQSEQDRRKKLRGLLNAHGWTVEDIY